jgi:transposase
MMLSVTPVAPTVKSENLFPVCCDVSKDKLDIYSRFGDDRTSFEMTDTVKNHSTAIVRQIGQWRQLAESCGYDGVLVVCEPTGGYEKKLLSLARKADCRTAYVSGEAVKNARVIESNDTGKSDQKDPRIIHTLTEMGKTLQVRILPELYAHLRELNRIYEVESNTIVTIRNRIHDQLKDLFPDLNEPNEFVFSATGRALHKLFGLNPARIRQCSWREFVAKVRKFVRNASIRKLEAVWAAAESSLLHSVSATVRALQEQRLAELFEDYVRHQTRKQDLRERILELYAETEESVKLAGIPRVSDFQKARLIAETGPLSDFGNASQLFRFLGMNIRRRQSGKWAGQNRISKKGRALGRKVLFQMVFSSLIGGGRLFADYYKKKQKDCACGTKAIVCVMRKTLKMLLGLFRSGKAFNCDRVFQPLPLAA